MNRTISNKHVPINQTNAEGGKQYIYFFPEGNGVDDWYLCSAMVGCLSDVEVEEVLDVLLDAANT